MKKTKRRILRKWVVNVLDGYIFTFIVFVSMTIDNVLDNHTYDTILLISTILALICFYLLAKFTNELD